MSVNIMRKALFGHFTKLKGWSNKAIYICLIFFRGKLLNCLLLYDNYLIVNTYLKTSKITCICLRTQLQPDELIIFSQVTRYLNYFYA